MEKNKIVFDFDEYILNVEKRVLELRNVENYRNNLEYQKLRRQFRGLVKETAERSKIHKSVMAYFYGMVASGETPLKASKYAEYYIGDDNLEVVVRINGNL